jgi:hypothetical protein
MLIFAKFPTLFISEVAEANAVQRKKDGRCYLARHLSRSAAGVLLPVIRWAIN